MQGILFYLFFILFLERLKMMILGSVRYYRDRGYYVSRSCTNYTPSAILLPSTVFS